MEKRMTLINLIGEQPVPNLLVIKHMQPSENILLYSDTTEKTAKRLERLVQVKKKIKTDPYDIDKIVSETISFLESDNKLVFNITGGTKIMSAALFKIALEKKADFVYLQSEGNQSLLFKYTFQDMNIVVSKEYLPELIDNDTYLKAHINDYYIDNSITSGSDFENSVANALKENNFEILQNIRPKGEGNQLEIDLLLRIKGTNNVAIAEIKTGDEEEEGPKKGIEQLALAGQREYLGIYTKRFLITQRILSKQIKELALAHKIIIIDELQYDFKRKVISEESKKKLIERITEKLT